MAGLTLALQFRDNNDKRAEMRVILPAYLAISTAAAYLQGLATVAQPLSNAAIIGAEIRYAVELPTSPPAAPESSVYSRAVYIFRNGADRGVLSLPSPAPVSFDVDGPYRGIRVSRGRLVLLGVLAALEAALSGSILPSGAAFPTTFVVGGATTLDGE